MKENTEIQGENRYQTGRAGLAGTGIVMLLSSIIMASGCLSVPIRQSHRDMEMMATADISGIDSLPRQSGGDYTVSPGVQDLLEDELTPDTAVRVALWNNQRIQAEYERLDMATADRLAARLLKNPQVHGSVIVSDEDSSEEVIELGAEIDLLHMILLSKRRQIGAARYEAVKIDVARAVQKLAYDTRIACYRLLAARQRLAMRESVMESAEAGRDMAERLREAGNIKELDKLNREALYEQAALGLSAAELAVAEARENLNVLMGLSNDDTGWRMAGELPSPVDNEMAVEDAVKDSLQNSVQLEMTRWKIEAAAQALGIARAESAVPALHIGIDAEREPDGVWMVGPMISVELPLFDFGQARRPAAAATLRRMHQEYAALAVEVSAAARRAVKRADVAAGRVRRYEEKILPLRKEIMDRTQLQYNAMQLGVFQLLQSLEMEIAANSAYIDELLNYWIATIEVEQVRKGLLVESSGAASLPEDGRMAGNGNGGGH